MWRQRWLDRLWFLVCAIGSSLWCLTAAAQLGPTFDEPLYLERGLTGWRTFSHWGLLQLGTMPLPIDVQTLPLFLWETTHDTAIDLQADIDAALFWMRVGNLVFWWLLLLYGRRLGKLLAGPWGARLAVGMLACEPNLLAHAALATTDIALTACLLALVYYFRRGREADAWKRVGVPALWFGLAIVAKASAIVYGPICLLVLEAERLLRSDAYLADTKDGWKQRVANVWRGIQPARRDLTWIGCGGLAVALLYCGSDFRTQPAFVHWAKGLSHGFLADCMVWLSEHLCIFSNAAEGIVRQIKHNMRGHGTYLLGESHPRSLWYYFPVLLTIKLSLPVLVAPIVVALARPRSLTNWACLTSLVLLAFSLTFRVQIGVRLVLPVVALGVVGLSAALAESIQFARRDWPRPALIGFAGAALLWMTISMGNVWPHGLCYINELWGGPAHGFELVSDSNYDWGQGVPELAAWQKQCGATVDVWYFGRDQAHTKPPLRGVPLQSLKVDSPEEMMAHIQSDYLAVSTSLIYGQVTKLPAHRNAAEFLRGCAPAARTTTFLIYDRRSLAYKAESK